VKVTYSWLTEYTPLASPKELAQRLTLAGLEVESVTPVAPPFSGVVVGEVLESARHPDAEKLSVCQVTTDGSNRLQIICGAKNVRAGLKVAVAMVGSRLLNDMVIGRAKLRGLESNGMLCSARELGLGDEHEGIMELPDSPPLGRDLREALDLNDVMLEVNATPNRGDCMSVFGIARDYAAAQERRYLTARVEPVAARGTAVFPVSLEAPAACPVFASRVIRGVKAGAASPAWLRERLRRVGINSISPIVDVTNYVMMDLGQPMHAYDLARVEEGIRVRPAKPGERLTLLDDKEYLLDPDFLVIADARGAIGLAGVMGGRGTAISDSTSDVLLESAHFAPDAIAGRARRLGLFTDAAQRFERGVDPTLPPVALERATALLVGIVGGEPGPVQVTRAAVAEAEEWVSLRRARLARLLGVSVPDDEVHAVLAAVSGRVETAADGWRVRRPPHRFDIRIEEDLIEEVARLRGFDTIAESHAVAPQIAGESTESRVSNERLLTAMADRGYREVITYSFVDPVLQQQLFPNTPSLRLKNPISADLADMRVSLWVGLVQACRENLRRQQTRVRLFEIGKKFELQSTGLGKAFNKRGDPFKTPVDPLKEIETLAGISTGTRSPEQWGSEREPLDFYDVKADLIAALALTGDVSSVRFEADTLSCLRPGRAARIYRGSTAVGWLGELHPQLLKALNLSSAVFLFELEVDAAFRSKSLQFHKISKFPSVRRDLSIVVDENVPLAVLQENVTVSASGLLSELRVFDVYRGPGVESGRKSIALGLILQDSSRTLTDVDADSVVTAVVARLRDELSATIRDQ
jgi:phenylalanyl-tRNA synthetase beta chain